MARGPGFLLTAVKSIFVLMKNCRKTKAETLETEDGKLKCTPEVAKLKLRNESFKSHNQWNFSLLLC